jgi:Bacterial regulatory proteins, gntR family
MTLHDQASSTAARALPAEADFLPPLQRDRKVSLERQLVQALRAAIVSGRLRPGMRLPSSRCLAAELHINRNTIVNAQLIAEDYLTGKVGAGTFVNHHLMVSSPVPMPSPSIEHARLATPHPGTTGSPASHGHARISCLPALDGGVSTGLVAEVMALSTAPAPAR